MVRLKLKTRTHIFLHGQPTPWTLPSNIALCVNPEEDYAKVKQLTDITYYMAVALLDTVLGKLGDEENGVKGL